MSKVCHCGWHETVWLFYTKDRTHHRTCQCGSKVNHPPWVHDLSVWSPGGRTTFEGSGNIPKSDLIRKIRYWCPWFFGVSCSWPLPHPSEALSWTLPPGCCSSECVVNVSQPWPMAWPGHPCLCASLFGGVCIFIVPFSLLWRRKCSLPKVLFRSHEHQSERGKTASLPLWRYQVKSSWSRAHRDPGQPFPLHSLFSQLRWDQSSRIIPFCWERIPCLLWIIDFLHLCSSWLENIRERNSWVWVSGRSQAEVTCPQRHTLFKQEACTLALK